MTAVRCEDDKRIVETEDGNVYEARAVILANGAKHRHLGLANEERFIGEGISFCAVCDGTERQIKYLLAESYNGKKIAVGKGDVPVAHQLFDLFIYSAVEDGLARRAIFCV